MRSDADNDYDDKDDLFRTQLSLIFHETIKMRRYDLDQLPPLAFDHEQIVQEALKALRVYLYLQPIGYSMLPEKFTLAEIHTLYQTLLGRKFDVSNFAKKLTLLGIIRRLGEHRVVGGHRSPYLFTFDKEKYEQALADGVVQNI